MKRPLTLRFRTRAVVVFGLLVILGGIGSCGSDQDAQPLPPADQHTDAQPGLDRVIRVPEAALDRVRTEAVEIRPLERLISAPGEVALDLDRVAKITSRIDGQIEQMFAILGDHVEAGQALAAVGSLRLDELIEQVLVRKAQAEVAAHQYRRTKMLWTEKVASDRRLMEDRGAYREALARYQHAREKLLNMGLTDRELTRLEEGSHGEEHRYLLKTPVEGVIVSQHVVLGEGVSAGSELFKVVDTGMVWVFANLPIEDARLFKVGDSGSILPRGGRPVEAPLSYLAPVADQKTRTLQVRFDVPNAEGYLKPQEYVTVELTIRTPPKLAVPRTAVTMVKEIPGVFRQQAEAFVFTPVEIGEEGRAWVEVRKGIQAEDRVATAGILDLKSALLQESIQGAGEG